MLAGRLCLAVGIVDVEQWLTTDDAGRILDWWEAYDRINPLPDSWVQTASLCERVERLGYMVQAFAGAKVSHDDIRSWQSFMPPRFVADKQRPKAQSPDEQRKIIEQWAGR